MGTERRSLPARRFAAAIAARWSAFWFTPEKPQALGLCRVIFAGGLLLSRLGARSAEWGDLPQRFYIPVWLLDVLNLPLLRMHTVRAMVIAWWIALLMAAIGSFARTSMLVALVLGAYLLALPSSFGKVGHGDQMTVLIMLILALSRCGDAYSLDAWFARRRGYPPPAPSADYRWPIRMVWVLMAAVFCSAGATKLTRSGLEWITSDTFALMLQRAHYGLERPGTSIGLWVAQHPALCHVMAAGALCLELFFPFALLGRWARAVIVPMTFAMQLGIGLLMGIWFTPFLFGYMFWVPWGRVLERAATRRADSTPDATADNLRDQRQSSAAPAPYSR